jgi:hypothetical protein
MFTLFLVKHFICDFPISFQTPWMFLNKGTYGHPGGLAHAGVQVFASLWTLSFMKFLTGVEGGTGLLLLCFGLLGAEFLIHYHMDWFKIWLNKKKNYHLQTPQFWTLLGLDQLVHGLTYVGMIAVWIY